MYQCATKMSLPLLSYESLSAGLNKATDRRHGWDAERVPALAPPAGPVHRTDASGQLCFEIGAGI